MHNAHTALAWFTARWTQLQGERRRDEGGATAVEYLIMVVAAVSIAGLVAAAVTTYIRRTTGDLN